MDPMNERAVGQSAAACAMMTGLLAVLRANGTLSDATVDLIADAASLLIEKHSGAQPAEEQRAMAHAAAQLQQWRPRPSALR